MANRHIKNAQSSAVAGVAQWIECQPGNQKVASLNPSQGTYPGCQPGPQVGDVQEATDQCISRTLMFPPSFSLPSPLSKNK